MIGGGARDRQLSGAHFRFSLSKHFVCIFPVVSVSSASGDGRWRERVARGPRRPERRRCLARSTGSWRQASCLPCLDRARIPCHILLAQPFPLCRFVGWWSRYVRVLSGHNNTPESQNTIGSASLKRRDVDGPGNECAQGGREKLGT